MSNLRRLQQWLCTADCHGFVIPSTDEYLSEFAHPCGRRLQWATGFGGSTGVAVALRDHAAVFLDGRYQAQGLRDCAGLDIGIHGAAEAIRLQWLTAHLTRGQRLAIDTRLQPYPDIERIMRLADEIGIDVVELRYNPIDELWGAARPRALSSKIVDYPTHFAGSSAREKCQQLADRLATAGIDFHLLADPEDAAWLLNVRTNDSATVPFGGWHIVPIPLSRVVVESSRKVFWFVEASRLEPSLVARLEQDVQIMNPAGFESFLEDRFKCKVVGANLRRTPHRYAAIAAHAGVLQDDSSVAHQRWKKHPSEIAGAREGHYQDGKAVIRFLAWLQLAVQERQVTEIEAAQQLVHFRNEIPGYKGMSMPLMSASGPNGAMAHYVPSMASNRILNDHPIYWMDSGGQYYGCSTDNTVCVALSEPAPRHVRAHTLVVKGYIALTLARFPAGTYSTQLDTFARQFLWQAGMDYRHGTGHGVGNFMNIHEGPSIRQEIHFPKVAPVEAGMIVSNEPGYYAEGDFGVRVESHLVTVQSPHSGFLEFEVLSRLPLDPRLVDECLLTSAEKKWLADYHVRIAAGYNGCFDKQTAAWLQNITASFAAMAGR